MQGIEDLSINPRKIYTVKEITKLIGKLKKISMFTVLYYIKMWQLKATKGQRDGMWVVKCLVLGKDLEKFLTAKFF